MKSNKYVLGILAHVDSGKTTLAESILYKCGSIRKLGRVDHKNAFLDTEELERMRGITIFSKQAQLKIGDKDVSILDTPGHVDFLAEMERTLQVLDYAILIISGADGVQGHTMTLWKLLDRYNIPVFIFINKMDQQKADKSALLREIQDNLDVACIDFSDFMNESDAFFDTVAMCDERLMDIFIDNGCIPCDDISIAIENRVIFPCFFGSALKQEGIQELIDALDLFMIGKNYTEEFGARVFKIVHDVQNNRLTYIKVTSGSLRVKDIVQGNGWNEKVDQIRIYSGSQYKTVEEAVAGSICAITGLSQTRAGEGLGIEVGGELPLLEPILNYSIITPKNCNVHDLYMKLCIIGEEEPELHIVWSEELNEIHIQVMGEIQIEVLKSLVAQRYKIDIEFGNRNIVYKETIAEPVVGIGHFEPLKHYAEVHLFMEPLERGRGLEFCTNCSEDILDRNWQRLIIAHLEEKKHKGVLIGAEITDMRISVLTGKAHLKHTEGGDFRQAAYRAVRNGLKKAQSILLEPIYEFRLEIPQEVVGRAMTDIQQKNGKFNPPIIESDMVILNGTAPVALMQDYQMEVYAYSSGRGRLFCSLKGYDICHNANEIIEKNNYDSENDINNPTGSIFCSHGAGFYVEWDKVESYAHVNNGMSDRKIGYEESDCISQNSKVKQSMDVNSTFITQEEIEEIFEHTFGNLKKKRNSWSRTIPSVEVSIDKKTRREVNYENKEEYLLVDGYNIIFAWEELKRLSEVNIDSARDKLMDIMCNYQGYKKVNLILVFDAYKVHGGQRAMYDYHNIHIVYTKEAETADQYIEKVTNKIGQKYNVTVATSDRLEQMIVWGQGAKLLSAKGLWEEVEQVNREIRNTISANNDTVEKNKKGNYLFDHVSETMSKAIKEMENA